VETRREIAETVAIPRRPNVNRTPKPPRGGAKKRDGQPTESFAEWPVVFLGAFLGARRGAIFAERRGRESCEKSRRDMSEPSSWICPENHKIRPYAKFSRQFLSDCQNPCYSFLWSVEASSPSSAASPTTQKLTQGVSSWFRAPSH
jgi:hypothetical protein